MKSRRFTSLLAAATLVVTLAGAHPATAQRIGDETASEGTSFLTRGWSAAAFWNFLESLFASDKGQIVP
jgi:hypothetical protein